MKFSGDHEWTKKDKLEGLQRWIIVQSILYYEMSFNLVSDQMFDANCKQLVEYMAKWPNALKKTQYYYCMHDFDGSTGFDLYGRLKRLDREYLTNIAAYLKSRNGKGEKAHLCVNCIYKKMLSPLELKCRCKDSKFYGKITKKLDTANCKQWKAK